MDTLDDTCEFDILHVPVLDERPWAVFAACKDVYDVTFFPQTKDEERMARVICSMCPVQVDCLDHALVTKERLGIWGGLNERERSKISRAS